MTIRLLRHGVLAASILGIALAQAPGNPAAKEATKLFEELIKAPVIPARSADAIKADLKQADQEMRTAGDRVSTAQKRVQEAEQWIRTQKAVVKKIGMEIKTAKKEKRETDKITLEAERKKEQIVQDFLEKMKSVRSAELNLTKTAREVISARRSALEAELDWIRKRETAMKASQTNFTAAGMAALAAQRKALKLFKTKADKEKNLGDRQKRVADSRIALFDAREKLIASVAKPSGT